MPDVVVAGGGLIGLAVAWRCARRGLPVTVVDESPGTGASYAAAGMLAPVTEAAYGEQPLLALCRASLACRSLAGMCANYRSRCSRPAWLRTDWRSMTS